MTGQLLKVTTTPFQAVRVSQSARLVSSDSIDVERRKAIARMRAFESQHSLGSGFDAKFVNKINCTFSANSSHYSTAPTSGSSTANVAPDNSSGSVNAPASVPSGGEVTVSAPSTAASGTAQVQGTVSVQGTASAVSAESNSAYTLERGSFEMRVAAGNLSFVPPLTMTVITQRPDVQFEYVGEFNYLPPLNSEDGAVNISI